MNNLSQKIYTDYTEARVTYKRIDAMPSSNYFPVSIMDKNNHKISLDYLNTIYDQIIIEIDYIYLNQKQMNPSGQICRTGVPVML